MSEITIDYVKQLLSKESEDVLKLPGLIEALHVVAQETCRLGNSLEEKVLGSYSFYEGQLNGIEIAIHLINKLPKATKRPLTLSHDEIEYDTEPAVLEYYCTTCGHGDIFDDHIYCPYCGAMFIEEENNDH